MIKYNLNSINDWNYGDDNIKKVYRNNAVCYYKVNYSGDTPTFDVCFAVVDDISQYTDREFEDVYDKATENWYKLNNLNQYEEYGVYGEGRNITYYKGKLTIDDGYEYEWNGSSWVNLGEVTGSTATLPDVPFTVNYNAKNYDASTHTFTKTNGQLADKDVRITGGTITAHDGYVTVDSGSRGIIDGYGNYFNRTNSTPNLTIISKQRTEGSNCHMFANRNITYNWMYRPYYNKLTLHGKSGEQGEVEVTTQPVIESVRISSNRLATYNNYTNNTTSTQSNFSYGSTNGNVALFAGYSNSTSTGEWFVGDFYWIYMSQTTLTDEQVQQVIDYNEGASSSEYPKYYSEKSDPLDDLTFNTLAEAQTYAYNNCVYDGMRATIDGYKYYFDSEDENGWVAESPTPIFDGKWLATYSGGTTSSAECDSSSAITNVEITLTNLVSVEIGDCVTSIGYSVFYNCSGLTSCTIGSGVTSIGNFAFSYCSSLTSVAIPSGVTSIGTYTFAGCKSLSSITIPDSVTSFGNAALYYCSGLTSVAIPSGVTSIGNDCFYYCRGLTSITIPDSVTSIGSNAFYSCRSFTSVTCLATNPPTLGIAAFDNTNNCPIYVPAESVNAYKAATNWSTYASRIQAIPT